MPQESVVTLSSSASLFSDKRDPYSERHFRWSSIRKFIVLSNTFASSLYTFDIFSRVSSRRPVRIFEYVLSQIFLGMGYLFMDSFIRQYTRRIDGYKFLNPLLSGVGYGEMLQTALASLLASSGTADALRFLTGVLRKELPWTVCASEAKNTCVPVSTILDRCNEGKQTDLNVTSVDFFYQDSFIILDRNALSTKTFVMGVIWICNFTVATLSDDNIVKFFQLIFIFKTLSTIVVVLLLLMYLRNYAVKAFSELVVLEVRWSVSGVISHMSYVYGIGFVPFYDFGAVSPYTMVDTAIILSSIYFTVFSMLRSWIIKMIHLNMIKCVKITRTTSTHSLFFALFPLGAEFVRAQKFYLYFLYLNIILSTFGFVVLTTISVARILHSEFRSVKLIYFSGVLSCLGFILSVPAAVALNKPEFAKVLTFGLSLALLYVGALKSMIVMWIYGLERFCTDINYWLGFKPTKFWKLTWALTPIVLVVAIFRVLRKLFRKENQENNDYLFLWVIITVVTVAFFNIKTAIKFLVQNNLAGLFTASIRYGPPDPSDRRNRRNYSETIALRRCKHNCQVVDDLFDCNHMPVIFRSFSLQSVNSSTISLMDIYQADDKRIASTGDLLRPQIKR